MDKVSAEGIARGPMGLLASCIFCFYSKYFKKCDSLLCIDVHLLNAC